MTVINIGTNKKNIVGVEVDKPFKDITFSDIKCIIDKHIDDQNKLLIFGWCDVTDEQNQKTII